MRRALSVAAAAALSAAALTAAQTIDILTQPCTGGAGGAPSAAQVFVPQSCAAGACAYASAASPSLCISAGPNPVSLAPLYLAPCGAAGLTQLFTPGGDGSVAAAGSSGLCWNVDGGASEPAGTPVILYGCGSLAAIAPNDVFAFLPGGQIFANGSSLCLDASPPPHVWAWVAGQVIGPDAAPPAVMAVADAKALCLKTPHCWAITYDGPLAPRANVSIQFKTSTAIASAAGWQSYLGCGVNAPCV